MDTDNALIKIPEDLQHVMLSSSGEGGSGCNLCEICQDACEFACLYCQGVSCQLCQSACEDTDQSCKECEICQDACEFACLYCQGVSCQLCQTACENTDQSIKPPSTYGSMTITQKTKNTVSVSFTAISGATYYIVSYRKNEDGSEKIDNTTNTLSYTFAGLETGTSYIFNYRGANQSGEGPYMPSGIEATTLGAVIPWDWNKQNVNASATLTQKAYEAISHNGPTTNFSYEVWNDIVDKAEEVVNARNEDWDETYGTAQDAKVDPSDKTITAKKFNAVWWNMAQFVSTGILEKKNPGDIIEGNFFEKLTDAINASIPS